MGTVNQWKWVNQFQPQTLYMATILCYVDAVFGLIFGGLYLLNLLIVGCLAAGAFGIANEKKWGYAVAVGGAHVNLIPLNPTDGFGGHAPPTPAIRAFADRLRSHGVAATVRRNRGTDIDAACGQLRSREAMPSG